MGGGGGAKIQASVPILVFCIPESGNSGLSIVRQLCLHISVRDCERLSWNVVYIFRVNGDSA